MINDKKVIVGIRTIAREQTASTFGCLYALRFLFDGMVIVGSLDNSSLRIVNRMMQEVPVVWDNRTGLSGEQASRLISHLLVWKEDVDYVLLLDDDQVFDGYVIEEIVEKVNEDEVATVVVQETLGWGARDYVSLTVNPSIDFFSLVRFDRFKFFSSEEIRLLESLNKGGEFFFMNWVLTDKGRDLEKVKVLDLEKLRPLHLWFRKEKSKVWSSFSRQFWDDLYVRVMSCKTLEEVVSVYKDFGLLEE